MWKRLPSIFFVLSFLLIFLACAMKKTQTIHEGSERGFSSPLAVLEKIDSNHHFHAGVKAIARIEVTTPEGRYPLKAVLVLKRPSSLRLESIPLIGPADLFFDRPRKCLESFCAGEEKILYRGGIGKKSGAFSSWCCDRHRDRRHDVYPDGNVS